MTAPPPRRPWWRRKRWITAVVLLLALSYPVSEGPLRYAERRVLMPYTLGPMGFFEQAFYTAYGPLDAIEPWVPGLWSFRWQWKQYCRDLADRHSAQERDDATSD